MQMPPHQLPDVDLGRRFLAANPPPGAALYVAVTGSHIYGFSSPDSDLDLKGAHLAPTETLLGLGHPAEAFDRLEVYEGLECDLTTNEIGKSLSLLLKGNGNMLERIFSPYQLVETAALAELRELARGSLSRLSFNHYGGFFRGVRREHEREPRAKSMLYSWRVALTGIHLMKTGELEPDLETLAPAYGHPELLELIAWKRATREKVELDAGLDARLRAQWPALERALVDARDSSPLPPAPTNRADCEAWLIALRKAAL